MTHLSSGENITLGSLPLPARALKLFFEMSHSGLGEQHDHGMRVVLVGGSAIGGEELAVVRDIKVSRRLLRREGIGGPFARNYIFAHQIRRRIGFRILEIAPDRLSIGTPEFVGVELSRIFPGIDIGEAAAVSVDQPDPLVGLI